MLENKSEVVVVTGASAGVGRAVVREFARRHAHTGLIARGRDRLEETKHEVERCGGCALVLPADVAHASEIEHTALAPSMYGSMTTTFAPFIEITPEEFKRATEVTYRGCVYGTVAAIVGFTDSIRSELVHDHSRVHITTVRLPAMNTPQFSWCRTRLPRHPQPVPPILEPEVAAAAIIGPRITRAAKSTSAGPR